MPKTRVTRRLENICQNFGKSSQTVAKPKSAKISTLNLNLKVQNIYIKPLFKPKNTGNKHYFKIVHLGENVKNLLKQKVAQNVTISLGS